MYQKLCVFIFYRFWLIKVVIEECVCHPSGECTYDKTLRYDTELHQIDACAHASSVFVCIGAISDCSCETRQS